MAKSNPDDKTANFKQPGVKPTGPDNTSIKAVTPTPNLEQQFQIARVQAHQKSSPEQKAGFDKQAKTTQMDLAYKNAKSKDPMSQSIGKDRLKQFSIMDKLKYRLNSASKGLKKLGKQIQSKVQGKQDMAGVNKPMIKSEDDIQKGQMSKLGKPGLSEKAKEGAKQFAESKGHKPEMAGSPHSAPETKPAPKATAEHAPTQAPEKKVAKPKHEAAKAQVMAHAMPEPLSAHEIISSMLKDKAVQKQQARASLAKNPKVIPHESAKAKQLEKTPVPGKSGEATPDLKFKGVKKERQAKRESLAQKGPLIPKNSVQAKDQEKTAPFRAKREEKDFNSQETQVHAKAKPEVKPADKPAPEAPKQPEKTPETKVVKVKSNKQPQLGVKTDFRHMDAHSYLLDFLHRMANPGSGGGKVIVKSETTAPTSPVAAIRNKLKIKGQNKLAQRKSANMNSIQTRNAQRMGSPQKPTFENEITKKLPPKGIQKKEKEQTEPESLASTSVKIKEGMKSAAPKDKAEAMTDPQNYPKHSRKQLIDLMGRQIKKNSTCGY